MTDSWDDYAEGWDADKDVRRFAELAFESLTTCTSIEKKRVLDFGCGTGLLTQKIAAFAREIVAMDTSPKMIAILADKQIENVTPIQSSLQEEARMPNSALQQHFDLIVASSVCGFLPDYPNTLKTIHSMLDADGVFVQWDWLATDDVADRGLTKHTIMSALQQAGFHEATIRKPFSMSSNRGRMDVLMACAVKSSDRPQQR